MCREMARTAILAGCLSAAALSVPTFGAELNVNSMPASTAIGRVDQAFKTKVALGPGVNLNQRVSFNIPDTTIVGGRLSAVAYLAHGLNADKRTILFVSKSHGTAWKAPSALDTTTDVRFTSLTLPATAILHRIAYVDNADVQYLTPISGNVTLTALTMPATQAAEEVAVQTHTTLSVAYQIIGHDRGAIAALPGSTIIGYTAGGQPITSDMVVTGSAPRTRYMHRPTKHASKRYAHRRSTGSISITSSGNTITTSPGNGPALIYNNPPATLIQTPPPALQFYNLPNTGLLGYPYQYAWPWQSPYVTGGVTVVPNAPAPPVVVVP